mmetsp:Transcript_38399/g.70455  ORF Transcript_38399/g.70455 Transcript_38399/m.70455 type:complete len:82 (-) Transcript_38399:33-278(-)
MESLLGRGGGGGGLARVLTHQLRLYSVRLIIITTSRTHPVRRTYSSLLTRMVFYRETMRISRGNIKGLIGKYFKDDLTSTS